jgi:hypothetical protein
MRRKAWVKLNFLKYSDSKRYHVEPDVVEYNKNYRRGMISFSAL